MILSQEERKILWNLVNNEMTPEPGHLKNETNYIKDLARIRKKLEKEAL